MARDVRDLEKLARETVIQADRAGLLPPGLERSEPSPAITELAEMVLAALKQAAEEPDGEWERGIRSVRDHEQRLCWGPRRGHEILKFVPLSDRGARKWKGRNVGQWAHPVTGRQPAAQPTHSWTGSLPEPPEPSDV